jgi:hypothetical protein
VTGLKENDVRKGITWLDSRALLLQLPSDEHVVAARTAVEHASVAGDEHIWGSSVKVGMYRDYLAANRDVFGTECDVECDALPPQDAASRPQAGAEPTPEGGKRSRTSADMTPEPSDVCTPASKRPVN